MEYGSGGGIPEGYEFEVTRQTPSWDVYLFPGNIYAVKSWEVLKGKRVASEPFGGHFTHASHAGDGCNNPNGVWGATNWDLNFSQTSASARIRGTWSSQGTNTPIEGFHSWSFQEIFP